jgi:hypothetical protein
LERREDPLTRYEGPSTDFLSETLIFQIGLLRDVKFAENEMTDATYRLKAGTGIEHATSRWEIGAQLKTKNNGAHRFHFESMKSTNSSRFSITPSLNDAGMMQNSTL